jgi:ankyrin repeat protein
LAGATLFSGGIIMKRPCHLLAGLALGWLLHTPAGAGELHDAILAGKTDAVEALLVAGADINEPGDLGTPLHVVAITDNEGIAKLLIEKHADIEAALATGFRPLHTAVSFGHENVARLLVVQGAATEARDAYGRTPLHIAAREGHLGAARLLLANGADVNARAATNRLTPLHQAILNNKIEMVKLLLDYRADLEAATQNGGTALFIAASGGSIEAISLLAARGAKLQGGQRPDGLTPLLGAEGSGHKEAADLLRRLGAVE